MLTTNHFSQTFVCCEALRWGLQISRWSLKGVLRLRFHAGHYNWLISDKLRHIIVSWCCVGFDQQHRLSCWIDTTFRTTPSKDSIVCWSSDLVNSMLNLSQTTCTSSVSLCSMPSFSRGCYNPLIFGHYSIIIFIKVLRVQCQTALLMIVHVTLCGRIIEFSCLVESMVFSSVATCCGGRFSEMSLQITWSNKLARVLHALLIRILVILASTVLI